MRFSYISKNINIRLFVLVATDLFFFIFVLSGANSYLVSRYPYIQLLLMFLLFLFSFLTIYELRNYTRGFAGESIVKHILSKLPKEYQSYQDIVINSKGNIDFVVVGPSGVWTIEVKSSSGWIDFDGSTLCINGNKVNYLGQAYAETKSMEEFLRKKIHFDFPVRPILVFSSKKARMNFGMNTQKGVYVLNASWLQQLILGRFINQLNIKQIDEISLILSEINSTPHV